MQQTQSGSRGFLSKRLSVRLFCLLAVVLVGIVGKAHFFAAPPKASPLRIFPSPHRKGLIDEYSAPRWMPDSKRISFVFRQNLYTRSVD